MRTITKTQLFIRLLFLFFIVSGALVSSFFPQEENKVATYSEHAVVAKNNQAAK